MCPRKFGGSVLPVHSDLFLWTEAKVLFFSTKKGIVSFHFSKIIHNEQYFIHFTKKEQRTPNSDLKKRKRDEICF